MGLKSRRKGDNGEREIVAPARAAGLGIGPNGCQRGEHHRVAHRLNPAASFAELGCEAAYGKH
jgi:hypothetical protein